jgi:Arc/MetJ-type ribon-helix-helix transcriptional regulator
MKTKVTYQLDDRLIEAARKAVEEGAARNMSDFVEQALEKRLQEIRREHITRSIEAASRDPLFVEDVREVTNAFDPSAEDGLR